MSTPKTAAEGDRERFEEIRAHYDEYGFNGPTDLDHERNGIIGFLLDAYDRLNVENAHLRDTDRDRDVELERLTAECDRLGAAGTEIGESWRRRTEAIEGERDALRKRVAELEGAQDERDGDMRAVEAALQAWAVGDNAKLDSALMTLREVFIARIAELQVRTTRAELDAREAKAEGGR